jgi:hypothetical protein
MMEEGVWEKIQVFRGHSAAAAEQAPEVDLVYIDGDHSARGCRADIELYLPKTRKVICGDDYCDTYPGIKEATGALLPGHQSDGPFWWFEIAPKSQSEAEEFVSVAE